MKTLLAFTIILTATTATTARAESLEEKQFWKRQRNYVDEALKRADKACDTKLTFEWVDPPVLRAEVEKTKHTPNGVCINIVDQVAALCRQGEDEKAAVKAKISGIQCGYAKERNLDLQGGIVKYMGNNTQSNFRDWARPWLLKHL